MGNPTSYNDNDVPDDFLNPSYTEQPTKLEMALSLFQRTGTSEGMGSVQAFSVRIPTLEYASIEALAKHSGLSRNKVIVELLQVALDEVWQGLDEDNRMELVKIRAGFLQTVLNAGQDFDQAKQGEI